MRARSVYNCYSPVFKHYAVKRILIGRPVQIIYILVHRCEIFRNPVHKSRFSGTGTALDTYDLIGLSLSQNMLVIRKKSQRCVIAWEIMSLYGQNYTSLT